MSISVSAFYPDAQLKESAFAMALTRVAMDLSRESHVVGNPNSPKIDVVFMLSGKFDSPGFKGMRIRRFDSKAASLVVEAAVPDNMVNARNAHEYVVAAIMDATENAAEFLAEIKLDFDAEAHMKLLQKLYPSAAEA